MEIHKTHILSNESLSNKSYKFDASGKLIYNSIEGIDKENSGIKKDNIEPDNFANFFKDIQTNIIDLDLDNIIQIKTNDKEIKNKT